MGPRRTLLFVSAVACLIFGGCAAPGRLEPTASTHPTRAGAGGSGLAGHAGAARPPPTGSPAAQTSCVSAESGELQKVRASPASPYFVYHPTPDDPAVPTALFFPSGSGSRRSAQRMWERYLSAGSGVDGFRIVVPYSIDIDFLDEVLACYGGDPARVHLAGVSNGGRAAFQVMLSHPERFATVLGAPGIFPTRDPSEWTDRLVGRAVFNGVGANDLDWKSDAEAAHEALVASGVESVYVEFPGQGHIVNAEFDESIFFDFWRSH